MSNYTPDHVLAGKFGAELAREVVHVQGCTYLLPPSGRYIKTKEVTRRMGRQMWFDDQVISNGRGGVTEDGYTKDTGVAVRYCESCLDPALSVEEQTLNPRMPERRRVWRLAGEFPTDHHITACKYCQGLKSEPQPKKKKGDRGGRYNEYVQECQRLKTKMDRITSEYLTAKIEVQDEKRQLEKEYRQWLQNH